MEQALIISLTITTIYICFQQGNILGWFRIMVANEFDQLLGKKLSRYIQKPLWDCIACMGSFWTLIICLFNQEHPGMTIRLVFIVTAINAIIDKYLDYES